MDAMTLQVVVSNGDGARALALTAAAQRLTGILSIRVIERWARAWPHEKRRALSF